MLQMNPAGSRSRITLSCAAGFVSPTCPHINMLQSSQIPFQGL